MFAVDRGQDKYCKRSGILDGVPNFVLIEPFGRHHFGVAVRISTVHTMEVELNKFVRAKHHGNGTLTGIPYGSGLRKLAAEVLSCCVCCVKPLSQAACTVSVSSKLQG